MRKLNGFNNKGFTLIELLMVILIIAILALMAITQFANYTKDARDASLKSNLQVIRRGIQTQYGQMRLRCNVRDESWPAVANLTANDITNGTNQSPCTNAQVSEVANKVFVNNGIPANPWQKNSSSTVAVVADTTVTIRALCTDSTAGWCYNPGTGDIWANSAENDGLGAGSGTEKSY